MTAPRPWTLGEYRTLDALAPDWGEAARVLGRSPRACRDRWCLRHPPSSRGAALPPVQQDLLALLILGRTAGLTVAETIEYFHVLSRHQGSSWRRDGRYVRTGNWEAS